MALLVKQGSFLAQLEQGTVQTIDVGFEPKALMFHSTHLVGHDDFQQATVGNSPATVMHGFATSPTSQGVNESIISYNGAAGNYHLNTHCIRLGAALDVLTAYVSAITTTGFRLTYDSTSTRDYEAEIFYTAIGGDEVQGAKFLEIQQTTTGNRVVTGLGFQPNVLIQSTSTTRTAQGLTYNFGVATTDGQWSHSAGSANTTSSGAASQLLTNKFLSMQINQNSVYGVATLSSFNPDGFTLNFTNAMLADQYTNILALKLATPPKTGSITQNAATGSTSYTGFAGTPKFMLFAGRSQAASTGYTTDAVINTGWTDGVAQLSTGVARTQGATAWSLQQYGQAINTYYTPLTQATKPRKYGAATVSFDPAGFTTNWVETDGVARQVVYLALISASPTGQIEDGAANLSSESNLTVSTARLRATGTSTSSESQALFDVNRIKAGSLQMASASEMATFTNVSALGSFSLDGELDSVIEVGRVSQADFALDGNSEFYALGGKRFDVASAMSAGSNLTTTLVRLRRMNMRADYNGSLNFAPLFGGFHYYVVKNGKYSLSAESDVLVEFDSFGAGVSIRLSGNLATSVLLSRVTDVGVAFDGALLLDSSGQVVKQAQFGFDTESVFLVDPTYIRTSGIALQGETDVEIVVSRDRQGKYSLTSRLDKVTQFNADYVTSAEFSSSASQASTANRLRELESSFGVTSDLTSDLLRIKGSGLTLSAESEVEALISRITSSLVGLVGDSALEVATVAHYISTSNLQSTSELKVKASPILLVTYEDAFGKEQQAFVALTRDGDKLGRSSTSVHGVANKAHIVGVQRRHIEGKSR